jgi:RNA polymerase-binding protein DksA
MDLDTARGRLLAERERLMRLRDESVDEFEEMQDRGRGELSGYDQHPADTGSETFEREHELSIVESVERELMLVDEALERLERGEYGRCQICGRPIGDERLAARPMARFCIEHQQQAESHARAPGGREGASSPSG